jgi:hypothetical protein
MLEDAGVRHAEGRGEEAEGDAGDGADDDVDFAEGRVDDD